jgi:hypothetical protein
MKAFFYIIDQGQVFTTKYCVSIIQKTAFSRFPGVFGLLKPGRL